MKTPLIAALLIGLLSTTVHAQGPSIRGYHKGFIQFGYSGLYYNSVFNPTGSEQAVFRNVSNVTLQLYAEYGIAKNWEIRGVLPYRLLRTTTSTDRAINPTSAGTVTGPGNIGLGLKRAILNGPVKLSVGVDALANTFFSNNRLGLRTGYEGWTVLPYLSVGSGGKRLYYYAEAGYGIMTQNYSNFLRINGELGYLLQPRLTIAGTIDFRQSAKNSPFFNTEAYQFTGTYLNDQQYLNAGVKAVYDLVPNRLGLTAQVIGTLAGENIPASRSYNAGVFIKW